MVYCEGVEVESKLGRLIQAFRCDRPDEWAMDEFIRIAEDMHKEITRLREVEKDAARYRWLRNCTTVESKQFVSESGGWIVGLGVLDGMIDQAMKDKCDE